MNYTIKLFTISSLPLLVAACGGGGGGEAQVLRQLRHHRPRQHRFRRPRLLLSQPLQR